MILGGSGWFGRRTCFSRSRRGGRLGGIADVEVTRGGGGGKRATEPLEKDKGEVGGELGVNIVTVVIVVVIIAGHTHPLAHSRPIFAPWFFSPWSSFWDLLFVCSSSSAAALWVEHGGHDDEVTFGSVGGGSGGGGG